MDRKLSFTTMGTPQLDHEGAIALAQRFGFHGVDLRCAEHLGEVEPGSSDAHLQTVARDFEQAGLSIPSVLCYHQIRSDSDAWVDDYAIHVSSHLRIGAALGAETIRVFGVHPASRLRSSDLVAGSAEAIGRALEQDDSGVGVVVQNHAGAGTALDAVNIGRQLDDPRFGLVYSPDHNFLYEEPANRELLDEIQPWTREVYIADLVREANGHRWVFPGEGEVPLRETVARLDGCGFQGFHAFKWEKIWNPDLPEPEVAMPRFAAFMRSL